MKMKHKTSISITVKKCKHQNINNKFISLNFCIIITYEFSYMNTAMRNLQLFYKRRIAVSALIGGATLLGEIFTSIRALKSRALIDGLYLRSRAY